MPESAQIETSFIGERPQLAAIIHAYESFLTKLNFDIHKIRSWIVQMESMLETEEDVVDVYKEVVPIVIDDKKTINCVGIYCIIVKHAYTSIGNTCILFLELLFNAEDIRDASSVYKIGVGKAIWKVFIDLHVFFPETKIYFTDEWQNGQPQEPPMGRNGNIWAFDAALIPHGAIQNVSPLPSDMESYVTKSMVGFARKDRWKILPWTED